MRRKALAKEPIRALIIQSGRPWSLIIGRSRHSQLIAKASASVLIIVVKVSRKAGAIQGLIEVCTDDLCGDLSLGLRKLSEDISF